MGAIQTHKISKKESEVLERIAVAICERMDGIQSRMFEICALASKAVHVLGIPFMPALADAIHEQGGQKLSWRRLTYTYARVYDEWHETLTAEQIKQANLSTLEKLLRVKDQKKRVKLLCTALEQRWSPQRVEAEVLEDTDGRPPAASSVLFEVIPADDQVGRCHDALTGLETQGVAKSVRRKVSR